MQSNNYVDISFTVLDRIRKGRRLLRDLNTGQIFWEEPETEPEPESETVKPARKSRKPKNVT